MRNHTFRGLTAAIAAWTLPGLLGLALSAEAPLPTAEDTGRTNAEPTRSVTASLDFTDLSYSFVNWGLAVIITNKPFAREPASGSSKLARGILDPGGDRGDQIAFILDRAGGKLYLDLNRNLDLTDDPSGVFSQPQRTGYSLTFTNVHLRRPTFSGNALVLMDLTFFDYGQLICQAAIRSLFLGKVTLQGQEWQVGRSDRQSLLLRPWSDRNQPFNLNNGSLEEVPFSEKMFIGNQAYRLKCSEETKDGKPSARIRFTEEKAKLGDLEVTGKFVERATLSGPYTVVLQRPKGVVKVPCGRYSSAQVWLKSGDGEASLDEPARRVVGQINVNEKRPAVLAAGGPLTNSVTLTRRGRNLTMTYELVGVGGAYRLVNQDRSHPPEFTVYAADKKIAAGKFEFG